MCLTGTCVLRQRTVPPAPAALVAVWNDTAYLNRGWCSFEHGMARVAWRRTSTRRSRSLRGHGAAGLPDLIRRVEHRGKLVDISAGGAAPLAEDEGEPEALLEIWEQEWRDAIVRQCLEQVRAEVQETTYEAFELFACRGWQAERVAEHLGLTPNAVFGAKRRVLERIRELRSEFEPVW